MVKVYSTTDCKFCKLAKLFLEANGVEVNYLNVETDASAKADFDKLGAMGAPVIVTADGEVFYGFTPDIQRKLAEKLNL